MQINRLFEIVYLLMNKKSITAGELAAHFEVSQRTIYRDIEALCQAGIPIYTNKGKGGGICLMEQFVLNKSLLSNQEQNDILFALQSLKVTNYPETDQVLSKLSLLFGNQNFDWIEVDFSNWSSGEEDKEKFSLLKNAILTSHVIQFDYFSSYGNKTHRFVEPDKLLFRGQAWYLCGYCLEKQAQRYFKITRIYDLIIEETQFVRKNRIEPNLLPSEDPVSDLIPVELKIDASMAFRIYDEFPREAVFLQEDGSYLIRTNLMNSNWLYGYLMSFEDHLEVIEPEYLRRMLQEKYKRAFMKNEI